MSGIECQKKILLCEAQLAQSQKGAKNLKAVNGVSHMELDAAELVENTAFAWRRHFKQYSAQGTETSAEAVDKCAKQMNAGMMDYLLLLSQG